MITGELKNKIDSLWDIFAAGGTTEQIVAEMKAALYNVA